MTTPATTDTKSTPVHNAQIVYRHDLNEDLFILRVKPLVGEAPIFQPGQFAELGLVTAEFHSLPPEEQRKHMIRRAYSIASAPSIRDYLEFFIVKVTQGKLTDPLHQLGCGDTLYMSTTAKGKFTLDGVPEGKDLVMIATGTGLAPFVSMLREYRDRPFWRKFVVIHGARLASDLGYREELEQAAATMPGVYYIPCTTREPATSPWPKHKGRIPTLLQSGMYEQEVGTPLSPEQCNVFLCGNPQMIETVKEQLEEQGFTLHKKNTPGNIHFERYW